MFHVLVDLTFHGFGHVGQTAPVVGRLREIVPDLVLTVRSSVPYLHLKSRFAEPFNYVPEATDIGMPMLSFREVNRACCLKSYAEAHQDWDRKVDAFARSTQEIGPNLVLSNVSYMALAAANQIGVPSVAFSSLNWADIYAFYSHGEPGADKVLSQMRDAYRKADHFLKITPNMPMEWIDRAITVGPVAAIGLYRRSELLMKLGLSKQTRLVLAAFGGMPLPVDCSKWPELAHTHFIVPDSWRSNRKFCTAISSLDFSFSDLIRSCDAVIAKPGYGIIAEAACSGTPVISIPRIDWPEQSILTDWMAKHGTIRIVSLDEILSGDLGPVLDTLPPPGGTCLKACPKPSGVEDIASFLKKSVMLQRNCSSSQCG